MELQGSHIDNDVKRIELPGYYIVQYIDINVKNV